MLGSLTENLVLFCRTKALLYDALALSLSELRLADREKHQIQTRLLEPVLPALERIESHLADALPNKVLADACCLSEDYFIRRFKECVGESPAHYIQRRRVETAANRLLFSADSIEQIAAECGFGNRFHFTRVFNNRLGIAPATFRKAGTV
jgi:transcriptional regulator GlxA family with amidase domain